VAAASPPFHPGLVLLLRLPAGRSSGRVAVWRRLKRLGARPLVGSAWLLADDPETREGVEWLRADVEAEGGIAALLAAQPVDGRAGAALAALARPEAASAETGDPLAPLAPAEYQRRTWLTRPRPGVDRMASAWLIRRFVDPRARFAFAPRADAGPPRAVPFDMFGAALGHQAGLCSFEVIARRFGVAAPGIARLGRLVRAVDLEEPFESPAEAALLERLVAGLRAEHADDRTLLAAGIEVFEKLHAAQPAERPGGGARRKVRRRR
jgi:hypothetical protein